MNLSSTRSFGFLVAILISVSNLQSAIIYDNSFFDLGHRLSGSAGLEMGDEINLAGTARYLTSFSFEYYGLSATPGAFAGPVEARVRFYKNDGTLFNGYATPSTSFFDSGWFPVPSPTPRNTFLFTIGSDFPSTGLHLPVATTMTFSVQFQGLGLGDEAGLDIFGPPAVGTSYPDYWVNDGGWTLRTDSVPMNFAARFEASLTPVPEPSSLTLALLGLGSLGSVLRFRRRNE